MNEEYRILVLTVVKDAEEFLDSYFGSLYKLSYPHHLISIGFLEGDSTDNTYFELLKVSWSLINLQSPHYFSQLS